MVRGEESRDWKEGVKEGGKGMIRDTLTHSQNDEMFNLKVKKTWSF